LYSKDRVPAVSFLEQYGQYKDLRKELVSSIALKSLPETDATLSQSQDDIRIESDVRVISNSTRDVAEQLQRAVLLNVDLVKATKTDAPQAEDAANFAGVNKNKKNCIIM
jgi:hypothetical protein